MTTITRVGPNAASFQSPNLQHSSAGRITALALGADGARMYAGSFAGVWRSDDGGRNFSQLTWPQPGTTSTADIPGALLAPHIFDIAASPADVDIVLACALDSQLINSADGVWRS